MLHTLLAEIPEQHLPPCPAEPDESRLCRAAGMLDVCLADPEQGLDFVRPVQAFLSDPMPAVTALALRAIAALCRGDCLDFDAALRIVCKKGKVAHTGSAMATRTTAPEGECIWGDARVMAALAELCGAGAEAAAAVAAAEAEDSDEDESEGEEEWAMGAAVETLLGSNIRSHPDVSVRTAVYAALGAHLSALLRAEGVEEDGGNAGVVASRVRAFVADALAVEPALGARASLESAAGAILVAEGLEPTTWIPLKCRPRGNDKADDGDSSGGGSGQAKEHTGPPSRLSAALPDPDTVLQTFRSDSSSLPGLAGAVLWSYPAASDTSSSTPESAESRKGIARREQMAADLAELLAAEGAGGGGLGVCPWQRAALPLGVQRYVARFFAACFAAESSGTSDLEVVGAAVKACERAIKGLRGVPSALISLALASLANCIPASFAHVKQAEANKAIDRLRAGTVEGTTSASASGVTNSQSAFTGDEFIPLCAAVAVRTLPEAEGEQVMEALQEIHAFGARVGAHGGGGGRKAAIPNDALSFWSVVALGVASEWACFCPSATEAKKVISYAAQHLLSELARETGSALVGAIAETWFGEVDGTGTNLRGDGAIEWPDLDVGIARIGGGVAGVETPATSSGSKFLALFMGLSSVLPGLRSTGMHTELLQVVLVESERADRACDVC